MHPLLRSLRDNTDSKHTYSIESHGDVISNTFFRMQLETARSDEFQAEFRTMELGPLRLFACHTNGPLVGVRTHNDIVQDNNQNHCLVYFPVQMQDNESSWHYQCGKESRGGERIITMVDGSQDYRVHRPGFLGITLIVPHALLLARLPRVQRFCIVPHDASQGSFALVWDFVMSLWFNQHSLDEHSRSSHANTVVELLAVAFESSTQALDSEDKSVKMAYMNTALDYVDAHLGNCSIRPEDIATHLGIKKRYLYALFADQDKTLHTLIRDKRLDRCRATLQDDNMHSLSITEIAFRWGFSSTSHFSRVFKEKYGVGPREFRQDYFSEKSEDSRSE